MKPLTDRIIFILIFIAIGSHIAFAQPTFVIKGTVTDASNSEALGAANVRVLGTSRGTITNRQGDYILSLESVNHTLVFSYLAYQPETLIVNLNNSMTRDVSLKPSPIQLPEMLVVAEDPAIDIIRKAIANKRKWLDKLKSYKFDAFTRQTLKRDTSIASITESYSTGYMLVGDTLREVIKQKRQTQNIPGTENFAAVHRIVNFNDDTINLFNIGINRKTSSFKFIGPTAPEALEYYDYKLLGTTVVNHVDIYKIKMIPKSRLRPLFQGTIMIAEGTYAVMGVDLKPNETFTFPFLKDINLRYRQQFALYDSIFWMPADNRINGALSISLMGFSMPRIGVDITSSIYDYDVNIQIPDSVIHKRPVTIDSLASKFDSTFWSLHEVLPLTIEEKNAYKTLDSTQTLQKQFEPTGPLASFTGKSANTLFNYFDARFNRVEGFFFGGKYEFDSLTRYLSINGSAGHGFSDKKFKYEVGATLYPSTNRRLKIGGLYYNHLDNVPDEGYYSPFAISIMSLIDKNDYRNYFLSKGWKTFLSYDPSRLLGGTISFINEKEYSLANITNYSFFTGEKAYRLNPPISEGTMRSIQIDARWGDEPIPMDIIPRDAIEISIEHSSRKSLKSNFAFDRFQFSIDYNISTFSQSLLFPPILKVKLSGGIGNGDLPPQRLFSLESRASGYAPFGVLHGSGVKEYNGNRFVMLNAEHNFRSIPFLALNIPYLYQHNIELTVHGSIAQTWNGRLSTSNEWYSEAGIGISRIFDVLRADITYRFQDPRRFYFSLCVANIF